MHHSLISSWLAVLTKDFLKSVQSGQFVVYLNQNALTRQVYLLLVRAQISNQSRKLGRPVVLSFIQFTLLNSALY